jgi:formylmethanofuran dehydrogenase subunit E
VCEACEEVVFEPYIRIKRGRNLCMECAGEGYDMLVKGKVARGNK